MAFLPRKTEHILSPDVCAPEQFIQWSGFGHGNLPCPDSPQTPKTRSEAHRSCVCHNFWGLHWNQDVWAHKNPFVLDRVAGHVGTSNVNK